jgi:hypothetical protein
MLQPIKHFYRAYSDHKLFIIASFVLFWPFGVYLMRHHGKWNARARSTITAVLASLTILIGVAGYNAPPTVSLANHSVATGYRTDDNFMVIAGSVSTLHKPQLLINDARVPVEASGRFSYQLPLEEGDTDVTIIAKSEKGNDEEHFKVHRTTASEFAERKKIAQDRKKAAEEKAAKAKAAAIEAAAKAKAAAIEAMPVCDGVKVTASCKVDGGFYKTYVYHPAVAAKTHQETETTYKEQVTDYCTLCVDGTYSPSCATGRGACSHHGGVAQWNAPRTSKVPVYGTKLVVDVPAKDAYYDKIPDKQFE